MTEQAGSPSDAPRRQEGTRTRSGNAMLRTRAAILEAAAACVQRSGVRRTTMGEVAAEGGVAKATLYNHFRTKDDVLGALVDSRVAGLGEACAATAASRGLAAALEQAASALAADGALRRVAADEPAALLPLTVPGASRGWDQARTAVVRVLAAAGAPSGAGPVDAVLRWLVGQLLWPATPDQARLGAALLAGGLPSAEPEPAATTVAVVEQVVTQEPVVEEPAAAEEPAAPARAAATGLGWPA